jgi:hypothetical protein
VRSLLTGAGWSDVDLAAVDAPMWFGADPDRATAFIVGQLAWLFATLDDAGRSQARASLHDVMSTHHAADGVRLGSGAWLVTAVRPR